MTIFIILKTWLGGKIELGDAYFKEDEARFAASKLISTNTNGPFISLHAVTLHGKND